MDKNSWDIEVPLRITRGLRCAPIIIAVAALVLIPSVLLVNQVADALPAFVGLPVSYHRLALKVLLTMWVMAVTLAVLAVKHLAYLPAAINMASLARDLTGEEEIFPILRRRLTKTGFVYLDGQVPTQFRITRISAKPNSDGTYWMMKTNKNFSKLTLQKYRPGEIPEPKNPDSKEVKYPWLVKR